MSKRLQRFARVGLIPCALALCLSACDRTKNESPDPQPSSSPRPLTDPDAYAVYAEVLPDEWPVRVAHATRLLIQETTDTDDMMRECPLTTTDTKGEWVEAIADFNHQNARVWKLQPSLPIEIPYILEKKDVIDALDKRAAAEAWRALDPAYPGSHGYIHLSAVGFDKRKTRAIVYVSHFCGGLCGGGEYHFLQAIDGTWKVARANVTACLWVS